MHAMQLAQPAPIESSPLHEVDLPDPEPADGEIRVRVKTCGICRTDLHVAEGELPPLRPRIVPGHQVVGVVDRLGKNAKRFSIGDRIGIAWLCWTCGVCRYCRDGSENLCPRARFTGYSDDGGYAQFAVVPEFFAYALPAGLDDVSTRDTRHQNLAHELGAAWVGGASDLPPEPLHSAVLFAPVGDLVPTALEALNKGGTLAIAGIYLSDIPPLNYEKHLLNEKNLCSVTANTRLDGEELLRIAAEMNLRPQTTIFPLRDANLALQQLKHDGINGSGVLIVE